MALNLSPVSVSGFTDVQLQKIKTHTSSYGRSAQPQATSTDSSADVRVTAPGSGTQFGAYPIDQVQVRHVHQCPFVLAPLTATDTDEAIVRSFELVHQAMRLAEHGPEGRLHNGSIRKVAAAWSATTAVRNANGCEYRTESRSGVEGLNVSRM